MDTEPEPTRAALEARIAALEQQLAAVRAGPPPLRFQALRLIDEVGWGAGWRLRPSPARRHWMDELPYAYQCLPLVMANQWGWQVLCPTDVRVVWDGSAAKEGLTVDVDPQFAGTIKSQFGVGIVTFSVPWLFRTSPGWDLYAKGPGNRWKPNCVALEGVIETWWLNYTFTLNWKLVAPGEVGFARGESIAQLLPVPHLSFEDATAAEAPIGKAEPESATDLIRWLDERQKRAKLPVATHQMYRKADDVEGHLVKLKVPPVTPYVPKPD